ncbi:MAG: hypothetical protein IKQ31_04920 [Clostridia bacterium]|nr:hypothetical protein [Clostridia bacterium]
MKTTSIKESLFFQFGKKDNYTPEELKQVKYLSIDHYDINGQILDVDFLDLNKFTELTGLTVKDCVLSTQIIATILRQTLKTISFIRCDFTIVDPFVFDRVHLQELNMNGCEHTEDMVNFLTADRMILRNMELDEDFRPKAEYVHVWACKVDNFEFVKNIMVKKIVVSLAQYKENEAFLKASGVTVEVLEDDGQFTAFIVEGNR